MGKPGTYLLMPASTGCCKHLEHLSVSSQPSWSCLLQIYFPSFTSPFMCLKPEENRLNQGLCSHQN